MMQPPPDPLSQLAMCCGLGQKRRGLKSQRNFYYSPSIAYIDPHGTWPPSSHFGPNLTMAASGGGIMQTPQPYFLLAQPVIFTGGSSPSQTNTHMTLVQTSQAIPSMSPTMPMTRTLDRTHHPSNSSQPQVQAVGHGAIMASHYAISSSAAASAMHTPVISTSSANIYGSSKRLGAQEQQQLRGPNTSDKYRFGIPTVYESASTYSGLHRQQQPQQQQPQIKNKFLSAELLAKLEAIEKQVDLSKEQEVVERHNIVITRALNPYTLMPHLTNSMLQQYDDYFLFSPEYVIRFIEIIKRPGQTLGLYLRSIQFEDQRYGTTREGLVITKIETDSPIYNSQVIHVGDEIISINLVEVQGMSMDDVVVIMSKPRRLVLALRIPKDRDHTIRSSLMQRQQQQQYEAHQQSKQQQLNASNYHIDSHQGGIPNSSGINYNTSNDLPDANESRYMANNMYRESGEPSSYRDLAQPQSQQDPVIHHARPVRVQSGFLMNENLDEVCTPDGYRAGFANRFNNEPHVQSLGRPNFRRINNNPTLQRSTIDDLAIDRRITSEIEQNSRMNLGSMNQPSVEEVDHHHHHHRFQEMDSSQLDQEFKTLVQEAMIDELSAPRARVEDEPLDSVQKSPVTRMTTTSNVSLTNNPMTYDNQTSDSISHTPHHHISSVPPESLTRRSLPTRPNVQASVDLQNSSDTTPDVAVVGGGNNNNSSSTDRMKPSAISNIRLGDTPEQSSYFSSSIDAINRELKELRRQRMALSNNETSIDSSKVVDYS